MSAHPLYAARLRDTDTAGDWVPLAFPATFSLQACISYARSLELNGVKAGGREVQVLVRHADGNRVLEIMGGHPTFGQFHPEDDACTPCACWLAGNAHSDAGSDADHLQGKYPHPEEFAEGWQAAFEKANDI
jgi:hypothetical protein